MDANQVAKLTREERVTLMYFLFMQASSIFEATDEGESEMMDVSDKLPDGWKSSFQEWYTSMAAYYNSMENFDD
jgi:hypothetical protein